MVMKWGLVVSPGQNEKLKDVYLFSKSSRNVQTPRSLGYTSFAVKKNMYWVVKISYNHQIKSTRKQKLALLSSLQTNFEINEPKKETTKQKLEQTNDRRNGPLPVKEISEQTPYNYRTTGLIKSSTIILKVLSSSSSLPMRNCRDRSTVKETFICSREKHFQ